MPQEAPTNEAKTVMPSATPPRPCWVRGKPSRQVTACGGWHGRLSRIEQIAPPYWAPYMTPASIRTAPTGVIPKVSGSRIEMVASGPMPGSTPTMLPTSTPMKHHIRLCGSSATPKPYQRSVSAVAITGRPSTSAPASESARNRRTARRRTPSRSAPGSPSSSTSRCGHRARQRRRTRMFRASVQSSGRRE